MTLSCKAARSRSAAPGAVRRMSARALAFSGIWLLTTPACAIVQFSCAPGMLLGDVARLLQLVGELDEGIASRLGRAPACADRPLTSIVALAVPAAPSSRPSVLRTALAAGRLGREHVIVLLGELGDRLARRRRADLLVVVEEHRELRVVAPAGVLQDRQRMEDDGDAALVVGDPGAVELVAVLAVRLAGERAGRVDRVHVGDQHELPRAAAAEAALDHRPRAARRRDPFGACAERLQARLDIAGHLREAGGVGAARLDEHHVLQAGDHRRLGGVRRGEQRRVGRRRAAGGSGDRQQRRYGDSGGRRSCAGRGRHGGSLAIAPRARSQAAFCAAIRSASILAARATAGRDVTRAM